jgi:hypothetical protein
MDQIEFLRDRLDKLRGEHRDLDETIVRLIEEGGADMLQLQRMKKRKLFIKDQIIMIESKLLPDVIA